MLTRSDFEPAFWLRNAHAQTVFASKVRPSPALEVERERLELDDGDFLDLSWLPERGLDADAPIVIVLHGLNGSLESKYARGLLRQADAHGARGVLMHFRGAAEPNRLARSYHSGETEDFDTVVRHVRRRFARAPPSNERIVEAGVMRRRGVFTLRGVLALHLLLASSLSSYSPSFSSWSSGAGRVAVNARMLSISAMSSA